MNPGQKYICRRNQLLAVLMLVGLLLLLSILPAQSQKNDSSSLEYFAQYHSPRKAVIFSIICPGLGQIYNRKYWKLPIIYGIGGTFAYIISYNQLKYNKFKNAYYGGLSKSIHERVLIDGTYYDYEVLQSGMRFYQRRFEMSVMGLGAIYLLNIIDAMVDAHLFYFDVSDDLSMRVEPTLIENFGIYSSLGFQISLNF